MEFCSQNSLYRSGIPYSRVHICQSLTFCGVLAILERLHFLTRSVFILSIISALPLVGVCMEREGCCELLEIPCPLLWAGNRHSSPLWLFCFLTAALQPLGWVSWEGRQGSPDGETEPSRVSAASYELIVCAQHGWEGTLHEFLKQFSAKTAPSTTWNSIFQGERAAWCGLLLLCHLLKQLLWQ